MNDKIEEHTTEEINADIHADIPNIHNEEQNIEEVEEHNGEDVDKDSFNPYDEKYVSMIKRILKDEQPATEGYLCKRLAKAIGFGHAGANVQRAVSFALSSLYQDPLSIDGIYSFWLDEKSAIDYKNYRAPSPRSITEIPTIEIANAIKEVIQEEYSLPKDKIPTIAARKLGFSSAGAKILLFKSVVLIS